MDSCDSPAGFSANGDDCDDTNAATSPAAYEICDGIDNNCDGNTDDSGALNAITWYADTDADGYGDGASSVTACEAPSNHVTNDGDCDDTNAAANPGADEVCDGADNDCDGTADEASALDATTWYTDSDSDSYGDASTAQVTCTAPSGTVMDDTDCNDGDGAVFPGASETCDGTDNDCDGVTDESDAADASTWYADLDSDGFGNASSTSQSCSQPSGHVADSTDCDDTSASTNPGGTEVCDFSDNDCDGTTDEDDAADAATWYLDSDSDGLLDRWEDGIYTAPGGGTVNLAAMGASKYKMDILVEVDWHSAARPGNANYDDGIWPIMSDWFTTAPVLNPDGSQGINWIIDHGQGGQFTQGGQILPEATSIGFWPSRFLF